MNPLGPRLAAVAAAVLFSTGGAAIKVAAFSPAQVSAVRSGIAALILFLIYRRRLAWSPLLVPVGLAYAAALTLFVLSTKLTTAANAIFLQSTAPIFILLLAPSLLHERPTRRDVIAVAAMAGGMVLCFAGQRPATLTAPNPWLGNLLALGSGLAWGLTLIGLRHLESRPAVAEPAGSLGIAAVITGNAIACAGALPWALPMPHAMAVAWATLIYLGVIQIGLAYVCLTRAMRDLPALEASLLLLIEPVLNPLWTWLVRGEEPGAWVLAGGAVIIGATAIKSVWDRQYAQ